MFARINMGICFILTIAFLAVRNHPNAVCGFRVTCTLKHPSIWRKVHIAAGVAGLPCCLLDLYALFSLPNDAFLILSWVGIVVPISTGCIATAILRNRQERQEEQLEEQQRKAAEQEDSSPRY